MLYFRSRPDLHIITKRKIVYFLAGYDKGNVHHPGIGEFLRDRYADNLNRQDLERMREGLRAQSNCNNTINKFQAHIRAILAWGVDQDLITLNPWRDYKRLKTTRPIFQPKISDLQRLYPELPAYLQWVVIQLKNGDTVVIQNPLQKGVRH